MAARTATSQGTLLEIPASFCATQPAAFPFPGGGGNGDVRNLACRTSGEQHRNLLDHLSGQFDILLLSPLGSICPRHDAFVGVLRGILRSAFSEAGRFDEDAFLSSRNAPCDRLKRTTTATLPLYFGSAPRQCNVARWKKLQDRRDAHTEDKSGCPSSIERKEPLLNHRAALRTRGLAQVLEYNGLRRLVELLFEGAALSSRRARRYKMRAVALLNSRVSTLGKCVQDRGPGSENGACIGFRWALGPLLPCPAAKYRHGRGNLLEIPLNHLFQEIDSPFPPGVYLRQTPIGPFHRARRLR